LVSCDIVVVDQFSCQYKVNIRSNNLSGIESSNSCDSSSHYDYSIISDNSEEILNQEELDVMILSQSTTCYIVVIYHPS